MVPPDISWKLPRAENEGYRMCPEAVARAGSLFGLSFVDLTEAFIDGSTFDGFLGGNLTSDDRVDG